MGAQTFILAILPLIAAAIVGFFGRKLPRFATHWICCLAVGASFVLSLGVLSDVLSLGVSSEQIYTWLDLGSTKLTVGFLLDPLSALMMCVVTFVSFLVHIYSIGYMKEDPGYSRFFAYISFFTFSMLMLVSANNFIQMFFGWEGVGLASYLLIGFWFTRDRATKAGMKAFVLNRVGDFGFVIGFALLYKATGSLDFHQIFETLPAVVEVANANGAPLTVHIIGNGGGFSLVTAACIALFVGAMGKSAQFPLHVWLPDSMEGPTPISALIHAATMVTAGIFMVARMSPVFELSNAALSFVICIGATTALFMAILGLVQTDIKRVIAYSTLSQLGYMTVALGASAYSAAMFHLMTHAFFKALLFLAAGSVILAMHHEQDMRKMGGLRKWMPVTFVCAVIGAWALAGLPPFSGFFSKEPIIEAASNATVFGAGYATLALWISVFLTAAYTFRMIFMTFCGKPRWESEEEHPKPPREQSLVVTVPLCILAIASIAAGAIFVQPVLYGGFFGNAIAVSTSHPAMTALQAEWHGISAIFEHGSTWLAIVLALAGIVFAWFFTLRAPQAASRLTRGLGGIYSLLVHNYYFDSLYIWISRTFTRIGYALTRGFENDLIDFILFRLPANLTDVCSRGLRRLQTGYLYHYLLAMALGLVVIMTVWEF
jgi:NADH-quinone oxidoreductase subunit L